MFSPSVYYLAFIIILLVSSLFKLIFALLMIEGSICFLAVGKFTIEKIRCEYHIQKLLVKCVLTITVVTSYSKVYLKTIHLDLL